MKGIAGFLTSAKIMDLATDPRVLFLVVVVAVIAVLMRWKLVLLLLFAIGGTLAVVRYTSPGVGEGVVDRQMLLFIGGILAVAVVLIYFLLIKGD
ncbi:MAG TPA: hypothetical protein VK863_05145 [Candidatus Limnocylindrales bacterium]|nr:hypothetical protein [Candidatus Limnocylindrales bacterium]